METPFRIIIVGGGTAGWMTAALLATRYSCKKFKLTLVESQEIGSIGVGEATLPQMKDFNDYLGISEAQMMQHTKATFKLGIRFVDWGELGADYYHPFGVYGANSEVEYLYKWWAKVKSDTQVASMSDYCYATSLCKQNRFEFFSQDTNSIRSTYKHGYHFDASLYANFLRDFSEKKSVERIEGKIVQLETHNNSGDIASLILENGQRIEGDFFVDCSGLRSLILAKTLGVEFEDWSKWLVCDRAVAIPSEKLSDVPPYTTSLAKSAGWQWKIPLQHRTGNGYVYSSAFISDQQAENELLQSINSQALAEPKLIKFTSGRYKKSWVKNCIAVGLSSGFLEPLESTSIYLIQAAIINFSKLFSPSTSFTAMADEFNRLMDNEYEKIRDFLILHYYLNRRDDGQLWRYCRNMAVPQSLTDKIQLFQSRGYIDRYRYGLFSSPSWVSVFHGQSLAQTGQDPFMAGIPTTEILKRLAATKSAIDQNVANVPCHTDFLKTYCC